MSKQAVRLADVFLIAPFLIYAGSKKSKLEKFEKNLLIGLGISISLYNGYYFVKEKKRRRLRK